MSDESSQQLQLQNAKQEQSKKIQNKDIFLKISEFLNISELCKLMRANKQILSNCQEYFRQKLYKMRYITEQQFQDVQNTDYGKIYRQIYNRDVLFTNISQFPIDKQSVDDLKVYRSRSQKKLFNIGIKKFSIGTKFTAFQTHENALYFCKTTEYFASDEDFEYIRRTNVTKFSTSPRNFIYLTGAGAVYIVFHEEEKPCSQLREIVLEWTLEIPVNHFKASYGMAAFLIKETEAQRPVFSAQLNRIVSGQEIGSKNNSQQMGVDDTKLNIVVYHINDLIPEDVNNPISNNQRMKRVSEYQFNDSLSFAVGYHQLLLVGLDNRLYHVDLSNYVNIGGVQPNVLPAKLHEGLSKKYITKVFSGFASFFAYEREQIPPMDQWNTEQVIQFLNSFEEFQDYINIVKYEGIKGSDLSNMNKKFMKDRLGLVRDDLQLKIQTEIIKYKETTYKPEKLYGWGKNDSGQLGQAKCSNISIPKEIEIPSLSVNDEIDVIKVGWRNSLMITKEKRIFITENRERKVEKKLPEKHEADVDSEEEKKENKNNKKQKKNKKESEDLTSKDKGQKANNSKGNQKQGNSNSQTSKTSSQANQQQETTTRWIEITDKFTELKDKRKYKIIEVSCAKDTVCVLGNCYDNKKLAQLQRGGVEQEIGEDDEEEYKKKLTPILSIINRIKWDPALDKSDFSIVYQDRFLKDLEMDFDTFDISDVKSYRVTQIKKNGKVVWDREKKFEDVS
ncbi:XPG I-region family protein (macronuclear) [Tetrahymena thermophila SB210]|uniref:XPG I-region family protein n=1 Tax=Tetrahymena thermophila (strain SB210) TaxID=312017 RepID=I7MES6_TETTS|nr:XPG I-region family protein [Tetrahymena thermophila SB210]EAR97513.2 XPG I-region family protein [Tetrahymena thermophila SB210]|eukprot:XP_001017758.2 XPG I-region family protein [Tetrahymena thermophila SB210]